MTSNQRMLRALPFFFMVGGCSDPATKPPENDSCKNVITYATSGMTSSIATYHYDDTGHITSYVETAGDGTEIFRLSRTYDDRGRRVGQIVDTTRFDSKHREMTWEYDDLDRVVRTTYDGWGTDEVFRDTRVVYDAEGRRDMLDTTENGTFTDRLKYVYIDGEPSIVEERHYKDADQSVLFYGFRYFLGQNRWLERTEIFNNEIVQSAEWYTYEDQSKGMVSRRDFDPGADNIVDEVDTIIWNSAGLVARTEFDIDANATVDQANDYEYDTLGRLVRRSWKIFDQGNLEFVTTIDWSEKGIARVERQDGATGQSIEEWSFDGGCPSDWPMDVPISPIHGFRYEMQSLPFNIDASTYWVSFDSL